MKYMSIPLYVLALLLAVPSARGAFRIYNDRSALFAASQNLQVIDFTDYAGGPGQAFQFYGDQLTIDGVTFVSQDISGSTDGNLYVARIPYSSNPVLYNYDVTLPLTVLLPPGTTAFGADFSTTTQLADVQSPDPFTARVTLADGSSYTFSAHKWPDLTFWGFTSDSPVASLTYSDGGAFYGLHYEVMDNVAFGISKVSDTTPPTVLSISVTPGILWPPNHQMIPVTVTVDAVDNIDPSPVAKITNVTSNEPENPSAPDWEITGPLSVNLLAERSGMGHGRIYTIHVQCEDASGNISRSSVNVTVPHDKK